MKRRTPAEIAKLYAEHRWRLEALLEEYQIPLESPDSWKLMAAELAQQAGLLKDVWSEERQAWIDPKKQKPGRAIVWTPDLKKRLAAGIDRLIEKEGFDSPRAAAEALKARDRKTWTATARSLSNQYSRIKNLRDAPKIAKAISNRLSKKARPARIEKTLIGLKVSASSRLKKKAVIARGRARGVLKKPRPPAL